MSHWSEVKTKINDLETFISVCEQNQLRIKATAEDQYKISMVDGSGYAILAKSAFDEYVLSYDDDSNYSGFAKKFGINGGTLMRDYAVQVATNQATYMGMMVTSSEVKQDGSIRLVLAA